MAYTTINKSSEHFNTKLYTGDGTTSHAITGVGFEPSMVWCKNRDGTNSHFITDQVRGATKVIHTDTTQAEGTWTNGLISFDSDGFTQSNSGAGNQNGQGIASWNWKANGAGSANTDGSISSTVSTNATSGFSIVKWTGNRSQTQTIGHGLGSIPKMIIIKNLDVAQGWTVYSSEIGANERLVLNNTNAKGTCTACFGSTRPTDAVFTVGDDADTNGTGNGMIAYCFADVQGYSKIGSYTGNNNTDGTFVYTGFSPAFIMLKKTNATGGWQLRDNKRTAYGNETLNLMYANATSVEQTTDGFDFLSNGFKWRNQASDCNGTGDYIYAAFAKAPLVGTNGVTAKAR